MREIQNPAPSGKGDVCGDAGIEHLIRLEREAWLDGRAGRRLTRRGTVARRAWLRGRAFAEQEALGLRPIDTVQVKP